MTEEKRLQLVNELNVIANAIEEIAKETEMFITINADNHGYRCLAYTDMKKKTGKTQIYSYDFDGAFTEYVD